MVLGHGNGSIRASRFERSDFTDNYFNELNAVNVQDKVEKKNGLSYLSWSYAWGEVKKRHPDATYTIYENADGWFYHTDGKTAWVKTGVTVNGIEHIEYLPVMDFRNKSIPVEQITSFDVNKTIQRSLTKAVARHGLGLYVYAGEDLPEEAKMDGKPMTQPDDLIDTQMIAALKMLCQRLKINEADLCELYKVKSLKEFTVGKYSNVVQHEKELQQKLGKGE